MSTISIMHPTITGEPPVMVGLTALPRPISTFNLSGTPHFYVEGFDRIVGLNLPDLQNMWRRITSNPREFLDNAIAQAQADLDEARENPDEDEGEGEAAQNDLYSFCMFSVLLDHAVENQRRPPAPPLTLAELDAALLALPRVTRVKRHGAILRVLIAPTPSVEGAPPEISAYHQNEALLHLARLVAEVVRHNEDPDRLLVDIEPGSPPPKYSIVEGLGSDGDPPDPGPSPVYPGAAPTREWTTYAFKSPDNGIDFSEVGLHHEDKAKAIDEAWDDFAEFEASKERTP
jgi:hypothetical protein